MNKAQAEILETIRYAMVAARNEALEEAAAWIEISVICRGQSDHMEGMLSGVQKSAAAIRALKDEPNEKR